MIFLRYICFQTLDIIHVCSLRQLPNGVWPHCVLTTKILLPFCSFNELLQKLVQFVPCHSYRWGWSLLSSVHTLYGKMFIFCFVVIILKSYKNLKLACKWSYKYFSIFWLLDHAFHELHLKCWCLKYQFLLFIVRSVDVKLAE